jgi:hypothetical protein
LGDYCGVLRRKAQNPAQGHVQDLVGGAVQAGEGLNDRLGHAAKTTFRWTLLGFRETPIDPADKIAICYITNE